MPEHNLVSNVSYCVYYPSNIFRNTPSFENWGILLGYSPGFAGDIQSCDAFRPIAQERKYLMDYKARYQSGQ